MENIMSHFHPKRIAVMMGGWSGERAVSLASAAPIIDAFKGADYECCAIDVTRDLAAWIKQIQDFNPDIIFMNALHGEWVEDGCMQGILEALGYPYTGSNVTASALAMDKSWSRRLFEQAGLPIAQGMTIEVDQPINPTQLTHYPYIIKPVDQGSSLGVEILHSYEDLLTSLRGWGYGKQAILERYIPGHELSVAVLGIQAIGVIELAPQSGFYSYEAKYTDGKTHHFMPARISDQTAQSACQIAVAAVQTLGVTGVSRVDFRYDDISTSHGQLYLLEVNALPGMTNLSLVPEIAAHFGMNFIQLLQWMIQNPIWPKNNINAPVNAA